MIRIAEALSSCGMRRVAKAFAWACTASHVNVSKFEPRSGDLRSARG